MLYLRKMFQNQKNAFALAKLNKKWRKLNKDNHTHIGKYLFDLSLVEVGFASYGTLNVLSYGNKDEHLRLGDFCSVATDTVFILSGEHNYKFISTYPFKKVLFNKGSESICKGEICIKDDVWIGYGCIILSGVTIGQGAVIGAGSVVTKDVPPYSVYAGGKIVKYRFSQPIINAFLRENILQKIKKLIQANAVDDVFLDRFYSEIDEQNVDALIDDINNKMLLNNEK